MESYEAPQIVELGSVADITGADFWERGFDGKFPKLEFLFGVDDDQPSPTS